MYPRQRQRWETSFGKWVMTAGVSSLADQLGVTRQAVYHWVSGRAIPPPSRAVDIIRLSDGALGFQDLYGLLAQEDAGPCQKPE